MSNPFILAIKTDPGQFLGELDTSELKAVVEGCVEVLEKRAKKGESEAPAALQSLYRSVANIEI
ncbi:MAG: hypothetical protein HQ504_02245 [Rhodospirillaceae bacterium]|nr:hypothetical protein [Rhodospirillaceae bacterium]